MSATYFVDMHRMHEGNHMNKFYDRTSFKQLNQQITCRNIVLPIATHGPLPSLVNVMVKPEQLHSYSSSSQMQNDIPLGHQLYLFLIQLHYQDYQFLSLLHHVSAKWIFSPSGSNHAVRLRKQLKRLFKRTEELKKKSMHILYHNFALH